MGQSKGTSLKSIKLLCFSLFQSCTKAKRQTLSISDLDQQQLCCAPTI